jgi:hypothetical protein
MSDIPPRLHPDVIGLKRKWDARCARAVAATFVDVFGRREGIERQVLRDLASPFVLLLSFYQ